MLKKVYRNISVYLLTALVLIAGSGITYNKMDCLMSGKSFYSFSPFNCCDDNPAENSIEAKCCDFKSLNLSMKFQTDVKVNSASVASLEAPKFDGMITKYLSFSSSVLDLYFDLPPPLSPVKRLTYIQVYRL